MSLLRVLETRRLSLVEGDASVLAADLQGNAVLAERLVCKVAPGWPPELYDRDAVRYAQTFVEDASEAGWWLWYMISKEQNCLVGICGYKGKPDQHKDVEIGYAVLTEYRGQGLATEAVTALVARAFRRTDVISVSAETFPHLTASIRVLEKNGFNLTGQGTEPGTLRYSLLRPSALT